MKLKNVLLALGVSLAINVMAQSPTKPLQSATHPSFVSLTSDAAALNPQQIFNLVYTFTANDQLVYLSESKDQLNQTHKKYQQFYKNIKVEGAIVTLHLKDGIPYLVSGYFAEITKASVLSKLTETQAFNAALQKINAKTYAWEIVANAHFNESKPTGELVLFTDPKGFSTAVLTYKFDIYAVAPLSRSYVYVNANSGAIVFENQRIHNANVAATGTSSYNGSVSFTADNNGGTYRLRQTSSGNGIETYDMNNGTNYGSATDITSGGTNFTSDNTGVQAHWGAEKTHAYFLQKHSRNSYNGSGAVIKSYVHYSNNYVNAYWDGSRMTYGDGDGVNYGPLVSLDIVGHEITHGVTEYTANLVYSYESGALNESFSDIFGEAIENFAQGNNDWQMGTDIGIGGSGALRSMNNPNLFGDPDTYGGTNWATGSADNGGVHTNSGVQNKWFYILSQGETGTNDLGNSYNVSGLGIDKAGKIAYRNLSVYLGTNSQYTDARTGAIQAAVDLYGAGSAEVIATTNAWYAVGVGGEYGVISYCASKGSNSSYEWISNVTLGSFSNNSGAAGYTNYTGLTVNVTAGQTYNISLTPGFASTTYNEYWKIWIDYNEDGDFTDAGELAYDQGGMSKSTVTGSISIAGTASGNKRMRVSMKYNGAQTSCETFSYGEVEDYTIAIGSGGGGDVTAPTTPGNLTASNTTQTSTDLSWAASTDNVGVSFYSVYVGGTLQGTTTNTNYAISGLTANTTYTITVEAEDAAGNVSSAASVNVTTLAAADVTAPTTPGNLTASNTTQTSTDVSWTASTDNVGVSFYSVYVGGTLQGTTTNTSYAISGLTANTTYTITVEAEDAAGNVSSAASVNVTTLAGGGGGPVVLSADYFESGWDGWTDGGSDCYRYNGSRSYEGSKSIRIRDNSGTKSAMTSSNYDLSSYTSVDVEFYFYPNSMENGEDFWLRYYNGSSWTTVASWARGTSFNNNTFYTTTVTLSSANFTFPSNAQFRFQCDASGNADRIYIDAVTISASSGSNLITPTGPVISTKKLKDGNANQVAFDNNELLMYPNPATEIINIKTDLEIEQLVIITLDGKTVKVINGNDVSDVLQVGDLEKGIYLLRIETDDEIIVRKFVKQ